MDTEEAERVNLRLEAMETAFAALIAVMAVDRIKIGQLTKDMVDTLTANTRSSGNELLQIKLAVRAIAKGIIDRATLA